LVLTFDTNGGIMLSTTDTMTSRLDLLQGTLDLLILRTLEVEPRHGWAISERIQEISRDVLRVNQGSLYPALHRLEHQGWIASEWGVSELGRRARFYKITAAGKKQLGAESEQWERFTEAVGRVMRYA
jgi:PadR family transcriptional regulator PadR